MARTGRIRVGADRAARGAGRSEYDRRALIVRFKGVHLGARPRLSLAPGCLEIGTIARRIMFAEKVAVAENSLLDEVARRGGESRSSLRAVTVEQVRAAPALQCCRELPGKIHGIFKAAIDP